MAEDSHLKENKMCSQKYYNLKGFLFFYLL